MNIEAGRAGGELHRYRPLAVRRAMAVASRVCGASQIFLSSRRIPRDGVQLFLRRRDVKNDGLRRSASLFQTAVTSTGMPTSCRKPVMSDIKNKVRHVKAPGRHGHPCD